MDPHRQFWNQQQQRLQHALTASGDHSETIELFLRQHAMVHAGIMAQTGLWSFEDEVLEGLKDAEFRRIPDGCDHSLVWILWHLARIEDVTMNLLVAGCPQLLHQGNWLERMNAPIVDTGNAIADADLIRLSETIEIDALRAYRSAVGRRTREIVCQLQPQDFRRKTESACLQRVKDEGAVVEAAYGIIDYWGGRTVAGLLLMPATRHNFLHLNEALRIKKRALKPVR